jgi:hypothetical protein
MQASQKLETPCASRELLNFTVGREGYGIDILMVQEIRIMKMSPTSPTRPNSSRARSTCAASSCHRGHEYQIETGHSQQS